MKPDGRLTSMKRRLLRLRDELAHDETLLHGETRVEDDEVDSTEDLASWMPSEAMLTGLLDRTARVRAEVEAALERLGSGTYGQCVQCTRKISHGRLDAIPYADTCIDCARAAG